MATYLEKLIQQRDQIADEILALSSAPDPDTNMDGKDVKAGSLLLGLLEKQAALNSLISSLDPGEDSIVGYT